jgi:hypothetical protein
MMQGIEDQFSLLEDAKLLVSALSGAGCKVETHYIDGFDNFSICFDALGKH